MGAYARSTAVLIKAVLLPREPRYLRRGSKASVRDGRVNDESVAQARGNFDPDVSGRRFRIGSGVAAIALSAAALAGCGGSTIARISGPRGNFPVQVRASFPSNQTLAQQTDLVVAVKNVGRATIPNVAVTLTNPKYGTAAQALGTLIAPTQSGQPIIANRSRPIWIINQGPGPCGYSCKNLGAGAGATAYSNTWALGELKPGQTVRFAWHVTAVAAGSYEVRYQVAADLEGGARATTRNGHPAVGQLTVRISGTPLHPIVKPDGQVVYTKQ